MPDSPMPDSPMPDSPMPDSPMPDSPMPERIARSAASSRLVIVVVLVAGLVATLLGVTPWQRAVAAAADTGDLTSVFDPWEPNAPIPVNSRITFGAAGARPTFSALIGSRVGAERYLAYQGTSTSCPVVSIQAWDRVTLTILSAAGSVAHPWAPATNGSAVILNCPSDGQVAAALNGLWAADRVLLGHDTTVRPLFLINVIPNGQGFGSWTFGATDAAALQSIGLVTSRTSLNYAQYGLSMIGTWASPVGSAWECADHWWQDDVAGATLTNPLPTQACDLRGYLVRGPLLDGARHPLWGFQPMRWTDYDVHAASTPLPGGLQVNAVRVGATSYPSAGAMGGFQVVALGPHLELVGNRTFATRSGAAPATYDAGALSALSSYLGSLLSAARTDASVALVLVAGFGGPLPPIAQARAAGNPVYVGMLGLTRQVAALGATREDVLQHAFDNSGNLSLVATLPRGVYGEGAASGIVDQSLTSSVAPPTVVASQDRYPGDARGELTGLLAPGRYDDEWVTTGDAGAVAVASIQTVLPVPGPDQAYAGSTPGLGACHPPEVVSGPGCSDDLMKALAWWGHQLDPSCAQLADPAYVQRCAGIRDGFRTADRSSWLYDLDCTRSGCSYESHNGCLWSTRSASNGNAFPAGNVAGTCGAYYAIRSLLAAEIPAATNALALATTLRGSVANLTAVASSDLVADWAADQAMAQALLNYRGPGDSKAQGVGAMVALGTALIPKVGTATVAVTAGVWFSVGDFLDKPDTPSSQLAGTVANVAAVLQRGYALPDLSSYLGAMFDLIWTDDAALTAVGGHTVSGPLASADPWYIDPADLSVTRATHAAMHAWVWRQLLPVVVDVREGHNAPSTNLIDWGSYVSEPTIAPGNRVTTTIFDHMTKVGEGVSPTGSSTPSSFTVVDESNAAPGSPIAYDMTYAGVRKLFTSGVSHPLPVPQAVRDALYTNASVYWPDVLHSWGLRTDSCNVLADAAGSPGTPIWLYPSSCYTGSPVT